MWVVRGRIWVWVWGLVAVLLLNSYGLLRTFDQQDLWSDRENHDTRTLLKEIRKQEAPLRWFVHDWPLGNGFYRPLPTLAFEFDDRVYHNNLGAYRFTNWLICVGCAFLLAWFVFELFGTVIGALGAACVFSLWQSGLSGALEFREYDLTIAATFAVCSLLLSRGNWRGSLVIGALALFLCRELGCWLERLDIVGASFSYRNMEWLPGRTATLMTLFALPCFASYCRFERGGKRGWAALSLACLALSFLCYEQAIVIPGALIACALVLHLQGVRVRWAFHALPWAMLALYVALHRAYLPDTRYRNQAYRGTVGALRDVVAWLFPGSFEGKFMGSYFTGEGRWLFFLVPTFWEYAFAIAANIVAYVRARKEWLAVGFGLFASVGTMIPMAFQHPLAHYFYLPMAFRAVFVAWLCKVFWDEIRCVAWRQELRARVSPVA